VVPGCLVSSVGPILSVIRGRLTQKSADIIISLVSDYIAISKGEKIIINGYPSWEPV